ncbi:MAG: transcription antitermination factor NusB [Coriobacteriaceae bacterium]|nr:transcription antitermination factor NusB [Coriobacteriaceae bacterium]
MLERSKARRQALNILYQREITGDAVTRILAEGSYNDEGGEPSEFCRQLVLGVESNQERIDETISATSENWSIGRMPLVDRSILRLAVFEILYAQDIPDSVSINEAVELAKCYGGDDSSKFVNGVLGRLAERFATGEGAGQGSDG